MKTPTLKQNQFTSSINRCRSNQAFFLAIVLALIGCGSSAWASPIVKANDTDNLNLTTSWSGGVVPGAGDIAVWNNTVTGANTVNLGASTTWSGIQIVNPGGAVTIANDGNTLTNGMSGIDLSAATQSLTLSNNVVLGSGPQNWTVASGQTLALGASLLRNGGSGLRIYLPDISAGSAFVTLTNGTPNSLIGGTTNSSFGNVFFATINDVDIAALNGSMQVVGESTVGALQTSGFCQGNLGIGANPTQNTNCLVEVYNSTASYGSRLSGSFTYACQYLNVPQTFSVVGAGDAIFFNGISAWQMSHTSGRNLTCYSILDTTNVGTSAFFDTGGGTFIIGTAGTRDLLLYQNNPAAPVVMQNVVTETGTNTPAFLNKFGAGTVELENANTYAGGTRIYEGNLKVDAIGDQSLYTGSIGGAPTAQNTYGSLGVSVRMPVSAFLGWTNSVNVYGGNLTQAAPDTNSVPITVYSGATHAISMSAANLQVREGTSGQAETLVNSSTNFTLTYNSGSRLQLVYANGVAPSTTVAPLLVTNAYSTANASLVANGTVTVDVLSGNLALGQFPLIKYSGTIGGTGGSAFVLGTIEPHAAGYISNNVANNSIDLVVTNITQPLKWAVGNAVWDIGLTANWNNNLGSPTTYQQIGSLADNVIFDDTASGSSPITVTVNTNPIPNSVTVNNTSKTYTLSGNGGITGLGSVTQTGTGTLFLQTTNTFTGGLNVNGGILNFSSVTNLGNGAVNFGGGTLQYATGTADDISVRPVTFKAGGGTIDLNGNAVTFANAIGNGGAGGFTLTGNSTLQINQTNKYSGNTVINSGSTLTLQSSGTYISNSAALVVSGTLNAQASGLTLSTPASQMLMGSGKVQGEITMGNSTTISPATNGTVGTLTINGDLTVNGGTLPLDIVGPSGSSRDLLAINNSGFGGGGLTLGSGLNAGTVQLNISGGSLNNGTYSLISYSGGLSGAAGYLNLNGFSQAGQLAYLSSSAPNNGAIVLNVISANTNKDVWVGGLNANAWDAGTTANWIVNGSPGGTFANGNTVTFDDTASSGNTTVGLQSVLLPAAMILNVTNNNYTLQDGSGTGAGVIVGTASLTINGPTLPAANQTTILTPNGNNGPTTINGSGTILQVGNGSTTGDIGSGNVVNKGTLIFDQTDNRIVVGQISGSGTLIQEGSAALTLAVNNTYTGPTIISNANSVLQVGTGGAVGSLGTGAVTDNGLLAFNRSGSVAATNISGSGSVSFAGGPTITLSNDTYLGNTYITNGSLTLAVPNQIPNGRTVPGSTGVLGLGGTLNVNGINQVVNGLTDLAGAGYGVITNGAAITNGINVFTIGIPSVNTTNTYSGLIADAGVTNKAKIQLVINGPGNVILAGTNTYSGGTIVGLGQLSLGVATPQPGSVAAGLGSITMSNGTTLYMGGNAVTFPTNPIIIAPNSTVSFNSQVLGNQLGSTVSGDASSTNIIMGLSGQGESMSANGPWNGFPGTVVIASGGWSLRFSGGANIGGGTNTTFDIEGNSVLQARTTEIVYLGALIGDGNITGPQTGGGSVGTMIIGSKGIDCAFNGSISGLNNIIKAGAGTLTLDGATNFPVVTGPDESGNFNTNYLATNGLSYAGATTISNGVLAVVAPANLNGTNFASITLAGISAVLDLSSMGYSPDGTNYVTNSVLTLTSPQTLNGYGTIRASIQAGVGTTLNPGNTTASITNGTGTGILTVTNTLEIGGAVNMRLDRTNALTGDELAAGSFTIDGTATLLVTNVGPALVNGDKFTLFSKPVSGFASVTLPAKDPTGTTNYLWDNELAVNGTITLTNGGLPPINPASPPILWSVSGTTLTLGWPTNLGWILQTNSVGVTASNQWFPYAGSASVTNVTINLDATKTNVFFRLIAP